MPSAAIPDEIPLLFLLNKLLFPGAFFCLIYPFFLRDGTVFLFDGTPCLKIRFFRYFPVFLFDVSHISVKRMLKSRNTKGGATETVFNPFDTCV